jgi:hypothetical protein
VIIYGVGTRQFFVMLLFSIAQIMRAEEIGFCTGNFQVGLVDTPPWTGWCLHETIISSVGNDMSETTIQ